MRYVVLGAGAVGGGVGGLLHLAGIRTTLIARGDHLRALADDGLKLQVGHEHHHVRVPVVGSPADVEWADETVVLLAVKSQQTPAALEALLQTMPTDTPVVSLQNGVANERTLLRHLPHVIGCCVMMPTSHLAPGEVVVHSAGVPALLDVGRHPAGVDEVTEAVAADLRRAGCASEARDDIVRWKLRKLLMNLGNGVDAACVDDADAERLVALARAEGERVLAAAGLEPVDEATDRERRGDLLRPLVDRDAAGSSTWQSLARGTGDVEVDHLNGEIVLLARLHGLEAPVNELVRRTVHDVVRRRAAPRSVPAATLLAALPPG